MTTYTPERVLAESRYGYGHTPTGRTTGQARFGAHQR